MKLLIQANTIQLNQVQEELDNLFLEDRTMQNQLRGMKITNFK